MTIWVTGADRTQGLEGHVITLDRVSKRFGRQIALEGVSLNVREGEVFGLVGPVGAGKSTVLRILATLVLPDEGSVTVSGIQLDRDPAAVRRLVGYLPERTGFYPRMTAREDLELHAGVHGVTLARRRRLAGDLLEAVDLAEQRDDDVAGLTAGQRRRLAMARLLVHDPAVLLLDEPVAGIDVASQEELWALLGELGGMGKTMIVSGRSLAAVEPVSTSCGFIRKGRISVAPERESPEA